MAKRKKKKSEGETGDTWAIRVLKGGPRDGEKMRLSAEPREYMRLAFPDWCTYKWNAAMDCYEYIGTDPPPKAEERGVRTEPWVPGLAPGEVSAAAQYIGTDAYKRGVEGAIENVRKQDTA